MANIFEKLRSGESVDMSAPEYREAIDEMKRSTHLCARIGELTQFRDGTEPMEQREPSILLERPSRDRGRRSQNWVNELLAEPLGENSAITPPFVIDYGNQVRIGKNVFINHHLTMMSAGGVTIDDGVMIGPNVQIYTDNHDINNRMVLRCKPVRIRKNAWIGGGAIILPGITVGENAVVGSGAVVTHDVEPNTIVAGNPARVIRKL